VWVAWSWDGMLSRRQRVPDAHAGKGVVREAILLILTEIPPMPRAKQRRAWPGRSAKARAASGRYNKTARFNRLHIGNFYTMQELP